MGTAADTTKWQIKAVRVITGQIEVVTGLRVGANQETMEISGLDNPILRNPANGEPYIPGSSLKGKLRSLAEWALNEVPAGGDPTRGDPDSRTAWVFGVSADRNRQRGPTRTLVRDASLSARDRGLYQEGQTITEVKTENSINRLTAMANPRPMERVVPGVRFDYEIVYRIFDVGDDGAKDEGNFGAVLLKAMALLETDFLGSAGSRGCGKIRFVVPEAEGVKPGILVDGTARELPPLT